MGFSVTVANVIVFIGLLVAGGTLASTFLNTTERVQEATSEDWRVQQFEAHTDISITLADYINTGQRRVEIDVLNEGTTVLNASRVTVLSAGTWTSISTITVDGDSTQRFWPPGTTARFRILVSSNPGTVTVSTENGITDTEATV